MNTQENAHGDGLHELAAQWERLTPEQRVCVLALIRQLVPSRDGA